MAVVINLAFFTFTTRSKRRFQDEWAGHVEISLLFLLVYECFHLINLVRQIESDRPEIIHL